MYYNKEPFFWDNYSDQPSVIKDKGFKRSMRKKHFGDFLKMIGTTSVIFPAAVATMKLFESKNSVKSINPMEFYGLGVNLDKGDYQQELIEELEVKSLIVRIPLNDIQNLDQYYDFVKSFGNNKKILLNIIQDRHHIDKKDDLQLHIMKIFNTFKDITDEYQIGTTINRAKWGFFSVSEYLDFYKTVQEIRDDKFATLKLLGPSVIDFEYYYTIRALFNNYDIKFDKLSSLLYVDRRGSPYNTQMGIFDTQRKIDMLYALVCMSSKMKSDDIYITEVNWPLKGTAPYAPTSEKECVSEEEYARYMVEYFDIAKNSGKVSKVFWHQLIASGYGLIDNRNNTIRKTKAFYEFKKLIQKTKQEFSL